MTDPKLVASHPSPWLLGLDSLIAIRNDQLGFYERLRAKHGDHVALRLGPYRSHIFFHPDHIEALLARNSSSFIRFRKLTDVVRQWNGNSLLVEEGESWRVRRRKVLPAFQTRRLPAYGRAAVAEAERLCRTLRDTEKSDVVGFDTDAVMAKLTLDIATRTLFGAPPRKNGFEIEHAIQVLSDTAFSESTSPIVLPDWLPLKRKRQKLWAIQVMDDLVSGLVRTGIDRGEGEASTDLLGSLIEHHNGDFTDIRDDVMSLLIAGHETSGALLSWLFACLAVCPDSLAAVQEELANVLGGEAPTPEGIASLPVLRATINETLRLYPPAYTLFLREAIEPVELLDVRLAKGDLAQIVPFTTHRDPRFFTNPDTFDPSRFLTEPTWPHFAYLPFGAGPRVNGGVKFGHCGGAKVGQFGASALERAALI
ncbi:Cytochrome P450 [Lutimaribacter pacificus]|uniref:Cytochrome P450 n=1 Tax=Lutimaribacter pacificus TaxID=391948 RepID=A0A1H0N665_9RHOB|nr:cytochrome P450 [Lutimaribacter pacificus]SDO88006.1 Cytochrome P450 [Lutimaribacter pacificus]SHK86939.1 Cytochrome P450 [Lutimaribacter pacificus]